MTLSEKYIPSKCLEYSDIRKNIFFDFGHMYSYVKLNFRVGLFSCIFWLEAIICCFFSISYLPYVTRENGQKWARKSTKSKHGQNCDQKWWIHEINVVGTIFGESLNYKSGLRILIWPLEVPFFWSQRWALLAKVTVFGPQKMALLVAKPKF